MRLPFPSLVSWFCLYWVFVAMCGFSAAAVHGLLIMVASLWSTGSRGGAQ